MHRNAKVTIFFLFVVFGILLTGCGKPKPFANWYIQGEYERTWNQVLRGAEPPIAFKEVRVWDEKTPPPEAGIWITTEPWEKQGRVEVYFRLSYDLEYRGAIVLALDPWMVFRKHFNPGLSENRALSDAGGAGLMLIPGRDPLYVQAWVSRLVQKSPGVFSEESSWQECEGSLFKGRRFPQGSQSYNLNDVLFRLMGNQEGWLYAPLSAIRNYRNSQKAILEATPFPESPDNSQFSLHANKILWAVLIGSDKEKEKLAGTLTWLKNPKTQTIIADAFEWIPADPYGQPYDPVSLSSHRNWLTANYIYVLNSDL